MLKQDATQPAVKKPTNRFGRKGGRGLRPWLLMPKIVAIAVLLGGLVAIAVLIETSPRQTHDENQAVYAHVMRLFQWMVVPGALVAMACGVGLAAMHGTVMFTRRWMVVKLCVIVVGGALLWVLLSFHLDHIGREMSVGDPDGPRGPWGMLALLCEVAAVGLVGIIWLGRHKPRLGQPIRPRQTSKPTPSGESSL